MPLRIWILIVRCVRNTDSKHLPGMHYCNASISCTTTFRQYIHNSLMYTYNFIDGHIYIERPLSGQDCARIPKCVSNVCVFRFIRLGYHTHCSPLICAHNLHCRHYCCVCNYTVVCQSTTCCARLAKTHNMFRSNSKIPHIYPLCPQLMLNANYWRLQCTVYLNIWIHESCCEL